MDSRYAPSFDCRSKGLLQAKDWTALSVIECTWPRDIVADIEVIVTMADDSPPASAEDSTQPNQVSDEEESKYEGHSQSMTVDAEVPEQGHTTVKATSLVADEIPSTEDSKQSDEAPVDSMDYYDTENKAQELKQDEDTEEDDFQIIESLFGPAGPPRRASMLRRGSFVADGRKDHLQNLMVQKRASVFYVQAAMETPSQRKSMTPSMKRILTPSTMDILDQDAAELKERSQLTRQIGQSFPDTDNQVSIRLSNFSYRVFKDPEENVIETVFNQSFIYDAVKFVKRLVGKEKKPEKQTQVVLDDITLNFEAGKMYLILGPPASGKSSLLKAIAGRLSTVNGEIIEGTVQYNGLTLSVSARHCDII